MGAGGLGGRPGEHVLRLLPRGVRARSLRDLDRPRRRRRPRHRPRRDALPLRAPAAARRVDAAEQPRQRQARARLVRDAAGRGRVPDPDGAAARAHRRRAVRGPHQAGRELPDLARPRVRIRALGGTGRLLALDDRGRDRRPRRRGRPRSGQRRRVLRRPLARRRRRLAALGEGLDGDDERAARSTSVLHPPLEDGRPERRDLLQRRQRRPDARPARGDRRRLPRAGAARRAARERSRRRPVAPDRRRDDPGADGERARLAPLQRRRLRRPGERRPAVGAERTGHGARLARALRRACRALARGRRHGRRGVAAEGHERVRLRRRVDPGAELDRPRSAGLAVRHRPDARLDRVQATAARPARRRR